ncbi:RagB/SusD family nutrient uptake outer membrane protein [Pedobacter heparinus]|uniref:RagB/SusD family nutrient uptake outer membrane protein n=1 Tax=Pedobacter heparinus TaxID=984 RepID=UPI0029315996|nr:RagB/SusD family nutrient uptake outer membrane protein [Pedobacter heparinus]
MKRKYYLLIISTLLILSSCTKFLDTTPTSFLSPTNYYTTETQLKSALAGVYNLLAKIWQTNALNCGWDADHAFSYLTSVGSDNPSGWNVSASDPYVSDIWGWLYSGINRANFLLESIDKPVMDENERNVIKGEALFLRAFYHFLLVENWGDVPLMTKHITSPTETNAPRIPAKEVYTQIIRDMTEAEGLVKTASQVAGNPERVSKSVVRGILARVCLQMAGNPVKDVSKYAEARKWAKKVIDPDVDGFQHALNPSFQDVFIKMCKDEYDIKESIWEIGFQDPIGPYSLGSRNGSYNSYQYRNDDLANGYAYSYGFHRVPARYFFTFPNPTSATSPDERRDWTICPYTVAGIPAVETPFATNAYYTRTSGKWKREYWTKTQDKNWTGINFPLLRFSDVLLMFAEADNQVNGSPSQEAVDAVNKVRRRAFGKDLPYESVKWINITNAGSGYTSKPTVTVTGGGGNGVEVKVFVATTGRLSRIKVWNEGGSYTSAPIVTITGGGGTGATAAAVLSQRQVSNANLTGAQTASKEAFQTMIVEERGRELGFEGLRKADLVRWGLLVTYMHRVGNDIPNGDAITGIPKAASGQQYALKYFNNVSDRDVLWPFSPAEMALNSALRPQNPGW